MLSASSKDALYKLFIRNKDRSIAVGAMETSKFVACPPSIRRLRRQHELLSLFSNNNNSLVFNFVFVCCCLFSSYWPQVVQGYGWGAPTLACNSLTPDVITMFILHVIVFACSLLGHFSIFNFIFSTDSPLRLLRLHLLSSPSK